LLVDALTSGPNRAPDRPHQLLVVAAVVTTACATAVDAAVAAAVVGAAGVIEMGCSESLHCAIQHV